MTVLDDILALAEAYKHELPPAPEPLRMPKGREIAAWIDQTLLKPEATAAQVATLCQEAAENNFAAVCVNSAFVPQVAGLLAGKPVAVCTVVGFPLGASLSTVKAFEALSGLQSGAREIDMVIHVGALKGGAYGLVLSDIQGVVQVTHSQGALVKVIIETSLLTREEKILACLLSQAAGADFVKTSTGFSSGGATVEDVALMRRVVGARMGVKASGGVRTLADAQAMIQAGATRIGTSSGVRIIQEALA